MAEDKPEVNLPKISASHIRVVDNQGNSGKASIDNISSLMGLDSYRFNIAAHNISTMDVWPGLYIVCVDINPEVVVFCIGGVRRPDWGIHILFRFFFWSI